MHFIGLFKIPCHFGQELVGGNADVNGEAQFLVDPAAYLLRRQLSEELLKGTLDKSQTVVLDYVNDEFIVRTEEKALLN